jgi:hypothetical protein
LPASTDGLSAWIARQAEAVPVEVPLAAVSPLRAVGVVVGEEDGRALALVPPDGDALDRLFALLQLPPPLSLPLRIQPAKASSLGWSSDLFSLTVLISNVSLRSEDGALLPKAGPVVAVCAEYGMPLDSLDPPTLHSRAEGIPLLRLPGGFLRRPLRVEATSRDARAPRGRPAALARAGKFLGELDQAWQQRLGPVMEVAWPVYRPERAGPLLDAVVGRPLPEMQLR